MRLAIAVLLTFFATAATAHAATVTFFAAPVPAGAADCSSPADACSVTDAVTAINAASVADDAVLMLNKGFYALPTVNPTALPITFAGPSVTIQGRNGTPTLSGSNGARIMSVGVGSTVSVNGVEFVRASSSGMGGAIENQGVLSVDNSVFTANAAGNGGAIASVANSSLRVEDSDFSINAATSVGGAAIISFASVTVERSAFFNNTSPINGGSVNIQPGGSFTLSNSTLFNSTSGGLGGGFANLGTLNVFSSTVVDNRGSGGGAIASSNPNVTIAASIVTSANPGDTCSPALGLVDAGYNLDGDGTCVSPTTPATGSHAGTSAYGTSTFAEVLDAYLADSAAYNGGQTRTFALLNTPDPFTDLANPALGVVPSDFDFPTPVDGESSACALADQRGVLPATGASCGIGAYLLQETAIELGASAASVEQNQQVTYTATVSPVPDGGTVSFDDGPGNPATSNCGTKYLANGVATCTVSYPDPGTFPVTASYSGDGSENNFAPSQSAVPTDVTTTVTPTPPPVVDRPLRMLGSVQYRKGGYIWVKVGIPDAGQVDLIGYRRVRSSTARFDSAGVYLIQANPKGKLLRELNSRGRGRALVKIMYVPDAGRAIAKSVVYPFLKRR